MALRKDFVPKMFETSDEMKNNPRKISLTKTNSK